jgi:hypothetical protein
MIVGSGGLGTVPEPASAMLMITAVAIVLVRRRGTLRAFDNNQIE